MILKFLISKIWERSFIIVLIKEKNNEYFIISESIFTKQNIFLGHFLHGLKLKSYKFNKYKTKKEVINISLNILGDKNKPSLSNQLKFKALEAGAFYARDLVSEPGNVLHPDEYAKRINSLKKDGLKINVYDEKIKKTRYACFTRGGSRKYKRFLPCYNGMEWSKKIIQNL